MQLFLNCGQDSSLEHCIGWQVSFFTSQAEDSQLQQATHVTFLLTGMDASLGPVEIPHAHGSGFARGCITEYDARAEDLGEIVKLQIWLVDKSGKACSHPPLCSMKRC